MWHFINQFIISIIIIIIIIIIVNGVLNSTHSLMLAVNGLSLG